MNEQEKTEKKSLNVRLDAAKARKLRMVCEATGVTVGDFIRGLVENHLATVNLAALVDQIERD